MKSGRSGVFVFAVWAAAVVLMGSVVTSYHQPFLTPTTGVLALVEDPGRGGWRMLHVLSGSCGCSQRVMKHLLLRHRLEGTVEQILLVKGEEADAAGTSELLAKLSEQGFSVTRIALKDLPSETGLRGVPLLVVASPENKVVYMGGYGSSGQEDGVVLQRVRAGARMEALPVIGCAVGSRIRRQADPFALKY